MLTKQKKSLLFIGASIVLTLFVVTFIILLVLDKNFREFKSTSAVIFAMVFIVLVWTLRHKISSSWGDELQKTIQLKIFSYTYIAFQLLLSLLIILRVAYHFEIDTSELLVLIMVAITYIQLIIAYFVKRKYR